MKNQSKFARFLNGKGFYIALGICMLAIGISSFTAISRVGDNTTAENSSGNQSSAPFINEAPIVEESETQSEPAYTTDSSEEEKPITLPESSEAETQQAAAPIAKYFVLPVKGTVIKEFSDSTLQYSMTYNDMRLHKGIDIKADKGAAVTAAGDGVVKAVENDPILGYRVIIDHGNGVIAHYCGLSKSISVKKGEEVKAGTTLAPLDEIPSESLDAPHLHLEVYKNDKAIDPISLITNN